MAAPAFAAGISPATSFFVAALHSHHRARRAEIVATCGRGALRRSACPLFVPIGGATGRWGNRVRITSLFQVWASAPVNADRPNNQPVMRRILAWCNLPAYSNLHHKTKDLLAMQHKSFSDMPCPIARSLERVGEWWSILILRDAFHGLTRFDQFQKSLDIAPNMLTRRLNALVEAGLLERRRYSERPARYEYLLTERGRDFRPVLWSLLAWGNKHFAPEGPSVVLVDSETGAPADPILVDRNTGRPLTPPAFRSAPGPAADEHTRRRHGDMAKHG